MRRRTSTLRPLLCAGLLSLTLLLAGCSDAEPTPKFEKPAASPTVAKEETAEEFIERWNESVNTMFAGDSDEYRALSTACKACLTVADTIDGYYEQGGWVRVEDRKVVSVTRSPRFKKSKTTFAVTFEAAPTRYTTEAGGAEQTTPGGVFVNDLLLAQDENGSWSIINYVIAPS